MKTIAKVYTTCWCGDAARAKNSVETTLLGHPFHVKVDGLCNRCAAVHVADEVKECNAWYRWAIA